MRFAAINCHLILVFVFVFALTIPPANAAEEVTEETPKIEILTSVQKRMQQEVSVDFAETPIDDVLRILSKQADIDIVKSPKVVGVVTATLTDVPLTEALDNILSAHGYGYVATENMIRVVPKEDILDTREKIINRVYRITYADVKEVEKALGKFISETGSISSNPGTSNVIVSDVESKIKAIDNFIKEIDRITPLILVEAKIYDVSTTDSLDMGVDWQAGRTGTIPATIGGNPSGHTDPFFDSVFGGVTGYTSADGQVRFGLFNEAIDLDMQLKLLQEDVSAKLLASPSILGLDNEVAQFKIVSEIPYQQLTESSDGGSIGTTAFREVGVELRVIPHVTAEPTDETPGMIRLQVQPIFSVATSEVQVGGVTVDNPQPVVDKRDANIVTLLRDGQTMVIAGLRKKDIRQRVTKVPFFSDLPIVGFLFKSESEETVNSQLFVFIKAKIVNNQTVLQTEAQKRACEELQMNDIPPTPKLRVDRTRIKE